MTDYTAYLKLETLLNSQEPRSDHPDELHFIVIHQIHELWFKLALHHLERAHAALKDDTLLEAIRLIDQVSAIFENARHTAEHLHSLPPASFHAFRQLLAPGSGLQSVQFREIELLAGARDERLINWVRHQAEEDDAWIVALRRLDEPTLAMASDVVLARRGIIDPVEVYADAGHYPELYALCEALSVFEHQVWRWRTTHIQLVERTIGTGAVGTGGTTHDYLQASLQTRFFPKLWAARDALTARVNAE